MGGQAERPSLGEMASAIGDGALDLSGTTDLERLAALLTLCDVVIANDSGPMHLAAALGTPVVAIFGSTDSVATAPLGPHRILRATVSCAPCLRRECSEGTYRCMAEILPDQVRLAVEAFLRETNPPMEPSP
jgi:ADP-heptose:LPS heptosyltransferase